MAPPDPVHRKITYELIEVLRRFSDTGSFRNVAADFGYDERTVGRMLTELNDTFYRHRNVRLIERATGRNKYELSHAGSMLVQYLSPMADAIRAAVDAATEASRWVPIPCTSNCLDDFHTLQRRVAEATQFDIVQVPRRSAETRAMVTTAPETPQQLPPLSLLSALMAKTKQPQQGRVTQFNNRLKVLPLRVEEFQLVAADDLRLPQLVSVQEVVEAGVALHVPSGGAAWDFLQEAYPRWHVLRPYQHIDVPHLDYGLKCLASRTRPRAAMVIHCAQLPDFGFPATLYNFTDSESHCAVTGLFAGADVDEVDPWATVWQIACALWLAEEDQ